MTDVMRSGSPSKVASVLFAFHSKLVLLVINDLQIFMRTLATSSNLNIGLGMFKAFKKLQKIEAMLIMVEYKFEKKMGKNLKFDKFVDTMFRA